MSLRVTIVKPDEADERAALTPERARARRQIKIPGTSDSQLETQLILEAVAMRAAA